MTSVLATLLSFYLEEGDAHSWAEQLRIQSARHLRGEEAIENIPKDHALTLLIFCDLSVAEYGRLKRILTAKTPVSLPPYAHLQATKDRYLSGCSSVSSSHHYHVTTPL